MNRTKSHPVVITLTAREWGALVRFCRDERQRLPATNAYTIKEACRTIYNAVSVLGLNSVFNEAADE